MQSTTLMLQLKMHSHHKLLVQIWAPQEGVCYQTLDLLGWDFVNTCWRYFGAWPWRHLKVKNRILKLICCCTGRQCRYLSIGVMLSYLYEFVTKRAAVFWMAWSFLIWFVGSQQRRESTQIHQNHNPVLSQQLSSVLT